MPYEGMILNFSDFKNSPYFIEIIGRDFLLKPAEFLVMYQKNAEISIKNIKIMLTNPLPPLLERRNPYIYWAFPDTLPP